MTQNPTKTCQAKNWHMMNDLTGDQTKCDAEILENVIFHNGSVKCKKNVSIYMAINKVT